MSDAIEPQPVPKPGVARIYMKSGNVIVLSRVMEITWEKSAAKTRIEIEQGGPEGGERLMVKTLDLAQIEAITWEDVA